MPKSQLIFLSTLTVSKRNSVDLVLQLTWKECVHCNNIIMSAIASQMTSRMIVYSTVYSGPDQRKHQSSASLAFVRGIHRWPVNSPHKGPVTRKCFHLMTSSCMWIYLLMSAMDAPCRQAGVAQIRRGFPIRNISSSSIQEIIQDNSGPQCHGFSASSIWPK